MMEITIEKIWQKFREYNRLYFNSELPMPLVQLLILPIYFNSEIDNNSTGRNAIPMEKGSYQGIL